MRRAFRCLLAGVTVVTLIGCSSAESVLRSGYDFSRIEKLAVVEVAGDFGGEAAKNQIADFFAMELMRKGYLVIERKQVQAILAEQQFQRSDLTTDEGAAAAGRILNVPAVLVVNVPEFGENISITAKMLDVEDGGMIWMASGKGTTGRTLATVGGAAVGVVAGAAAGHELDRHHHIGGAVLGGAAGGGLGGAAGYALAPQAASQAKRIIAKMCRGLPPRW